LIGAVRRRLRGESPPSWELSEAQLAALAPADRVIVERAWPYTLTSVERLTALVDAVRYCVRREIPGAFAECGVWLGGSVLAMILTLQELGVDDRDVYLFDTFTGMTRPTELDVSRFDDPALEAWDEGAGKISGAWWAPFFEPDVLNEDAVRRIVSSSGYPAERLHFVAGAVEQTIPGQAPAELALLRLDTDWYESTRHELVHLYPRLQSGGVLIVDDYGHWEGARRAVDEYFTTEAAPVLLARIDYTARIAIKH
jgi:hypothetical protein